MSITSNIKLEIKDDELKHGHQDNCKKTAQVKTKNTADFRRSVLAYPEVFI